MAQCRIRYAGERCGGLGETTVTWGAKAALSSCPSPMRAGSSQGTPLGNGRGAPGLRGQRRSWREESLGAPAGLQPGPRAQPPRQWRPSVSARVQVSRGRAARGPRDGSTGRPGQAASGGCGRGPGRAGRGGAGRGLPLRRRSSPWGPGRGSRGRASSPGERERGEAGGPTAGQRWGRASLTSRADFTAEPPRSPKKAL